MSELLKKAEILTDHDPAGRAITLNNFACYSRQQGHLHAALSYLEKAVAIEAKLEHVANPADSHLNLCAVLSQLSRHKEALDHCQAALALLQEELFGAAAGATAAQKPDRIAVLAICYHNIGVECEFLKSYQASLQAYTKGVEIASVYLGSSHGITLTLLRSEDAARQAMKKGVAAARSGTSRARGGVESAPTAAPESIGEDTRNAYTRALTTGVASGIASDMTAPKPTAVRASGSGGPRGTSPRPARVAVAGGDGGGGAPTSTPGGAAGAASPYKHAQTLKATPKIVPRAGAPRGRVPHATSLPTAGTATGGPS